MTNYSETSDRLTQALGLKHSPIAITFTAQRPEGIDSFDEQMPEPTEDGRTGRVPAGCVFWVKSTDRTFSTVAEDHANCSVGSLTHGFISLDEAATHSDVAALVEAGWVTPDIFPEIPVVTEKPGAVSYGPLADATIAPDVVLLRVDAKQLMILNDAQPDMYLGGKPQCHIVAIAKEQGRTAASVGCALSRVRTGMARDEMTCAIPADKLSEVLDSISATRAADDAVAAYAGADSRRFN